MRSWLNLAAAALLCVLAIAVFSAWRADRRERDRLQSELAVTQKNLQQLTAAQNTRDAQLHQALRKLAKQKNSVKTPAEALRALPAVLPLPSPIHELPLSTAPPSPLLPATAPPVKPSAAKPTPLLLPTEDLKPLYDYALDCQACQAKLAAAQANLADEKAKTAALGKERDAALRAARGGSVWKRIGRAAKWFAIGAAAGALAASTHH